MTTVNKLALNPNTQRRRQLKNLSLSFFTALLFLTGLNDLANAQTSVCHNLFSESAVTNQTKLSALSASVRASFANYNPKIAFFHQMNPQYFKLWNFSSQKFADFSNDWVISGNFIWSYHGKSFYSAQTHAWKMKKLVYLRAKSGWGFINRDDLIIEPDLISGDQFKYTKWRPAELYNKWLEQYQILPANKFSQKFQDELAAEGMPSHSQFYIDLKIAGYWIYKDSTKGRNIEWVFLHNLGAEAKAATD